MEARVPENEDVAFQDLQVFVGSLARINRDKLKCHLSYFKLLNVGKFEKPNDFILTEGSLIKSR